MPKINKYIFLFVSITLIYLVIACFGCGNGSTPDIDIWTAAATGNIDAVNQHITAGTDINETLNIKGISGSGGTPLHIAILSSQFQVADLLMENGADINAKASDSAGGTPLHWAAWWGNKVSVEFLLNKGADINAQDRFGFTPLDAALDDWIEDVEEAKDDIADFLVSKGGVTRD